MLCKDKRDRKAALDKQGRRKPKQEASSIPQASATPSQAPPPRIQTNSLVSVRAQQRFLAQVGAWAGWAGGAGMWDAVEVLEWLSTASLQQLQAWDTDALPHHARPATPLSGAEAGEGSRGPDTAEPAKGIPPPSQDPRGAQASTGGVCASPRYPPSAVP